MRKLNFVRIIGLTSSIKSFNTNINNAYLDIWLRLKLILSSAMNLLIIFELRFESSPIKLGGLKDISIRELKP